MKQIISYIFILFSLGLNSLLAQQGTFTRIYSGGNYDEGIAAFHLPDNTYRLIGNTGSYGWGNTNIWFIALDSSANFMWHKTIGVGGLDKAEDAVMDSKGNIFIVGSSTSQSNMSYQMLLIGIDTMGVVFTNEYYGGSDWDFGHGLCLVDDSLLMLVGETYSSGNGQSDAWMIKVNKQGDSLWSKTIGGDKNDAFFGVEYLHDFGFTFIGKSKSVGNGSYNPFAYHTNDIGDSIWYWSHLDITDGAFNDLVYSSDTDVVIVGNQRDSSDMFSNNTVMKISNDGMLLWSKMSSRNNEESNYSSVAISGDTIVAAGYTTAYGHGEKEIELVLLKNKGGWWIKNSFIGREKDEYAYSINKDTVGGEYYLIVGTTESYDLTHSGIIFLRLNSELKGDTTPNIEIPSATNSIDSDELRVNIFPNPFKDELNIDLSSFDYLEKKEVSIIDVYGRIVFNIVIENNNKNYRIKTNNLTKGVYYLIINSDKGNHSKMIIKQ